MVQPTALRIRSGENMANITECSFCLTTEFATRFKHRPTWRKGQKKHTKSINDLTPLSSNKHNPFSVTSWPLHAMRYLHSATFWLGLGSEGLWWIFTTLATLHLPITRHRKRIWYGNITAMCKTLFMLDKDALCSFCKEIFSRGEKSKYII